jgi:hypothetical protein
VEVAGLLEDAAALVEQPACRMISERTARSTERSELTFLVSVRVPHSSPGLLSEVLTSQRSEPCSMRTSETPSERMMSRSSARRPGDLGGERAEAGHRLGHDLDQRDAGPVVVDQRLGRAVDAPGRAADVQRLAGVLLEVHPLDADPVRLALDLDVDEALDAQRLVVLRGLEVLRHVGVEVVLPRHPAPRRRCRSSARGRCGWSPRCRRGWHRQRARQAQADRADLGVRLGAELVRQPQNILVAVPSSTCVSRPMTGS